MKNNLLKTLGLLVAASFLLTFDVRSQPMPPGDGGGSTNSGGTNAPGPVNNYPVPSYVITTNYSDYTNFWLQGQTTNGQQAVVSIMSSLPGITYEILTNSTLASTGWEVWQGDLLASNSITPAPPINLSSNPLFFLGQIIWAAGPNPLPFSYTNCDAAAGGQLAIESQSFCIGVPVVDQAIWTDVPGQARGINVATNGVVTTFTNTLYSMILSNWNVIFWNGTCVTNGGSAFSFQPTNSGVGTNIFYYTYINNSPCGGGPFTLSISNTFTVVAVASLAPTGNTNCTLVSSNATSQTWAVPVSTNPAVLEIIASSTPNLPASSLPTGWSLNGVLTNITNVNITLPGVYTIVCTAGTSAMTNIIQVTANQPDQPDVSVTTGSMNTARCSHTATLLPNGLVLVAGGQDTSGGDLASAELFNPDTGTWTATGSLNTARAGHTATLLPDGQVLVEAGAGTSDILTSAEVYNPSTGTWTPR